MYTKWCCYLVGALFHLTPGLRVTLAGVYHPRHSCPNCTRKSWPESLFYSRRTGTLISRTTHPYALRMTISLQLQQLRFQDSQV